METIVWCQCMALLQAVHTVIASQDIFACDSKVYCQGKLLDTVQRSNMFEDSKMFVDMPLKYDQEQVLAEFDALDAQHGGNIPYSELHTFVQDNFEEAGHELETVNPVHWVARPYLYYKIRDKELRIWADELNILWKDLARKMNESEKDNNRSSIIYVPNTFIVPGGRFREFYYWDSYWIINGVIVTEMYGTARGMIENFLTLVERYGFVPNGGRSYYTRRSQPPFLILMMDSYMKATKDKKFLRKHINTLEKEYKYWLHDNRTVVVRDEKTGESYGLARYKAASNMPRPEGYKADIELLNNINSTLHHDVMTNIASACESGWDFSTRWYEDHTNMATIMTQDIIPVDLNSILCANERLLSKLYADIGDNGKAEMYRRSFEERRSAIRAILWNEALGAWYDYDLRKQKQRNVYYISNLLPLFAQCYDEDEQLGKVLKYINDTELARYEGGVPTSRAEHAADEQWDYPNAWPPSVHMLIEGLANTHSEQAREVALSMAQTWISSNYKAWQQHGAMYEKYNAKEAGTRGGGGEYDVQKGFGWTNGVILMLLDRFGNDVKAVRTRALLFGLRLEALICILTLLIITGLILTGSIMYLKKKHEIKQRQGLSSIDDVQYAPVNTSVVSSHDNHKDNRENELKESM